MTERNWAGNYKYNAVRLHMPEKTDQIQQIVTKSKTVKVLGTRHSFNGIADTTDDLISLGKLNQVLQLHRERQTVTVEGGITYSELGKYLHRNGFALRNMASLPHISVAGACATATHGSGDQNKVLSSSVRGMELITAEGDVVQFSDEDMNSVAVGLGGLGVVTKVTLDVIPTFQMRQDVYENLPLATLHDHLNAIFSSAYSVSLFTDWKEEIFNQVWIKHQLTDQKMYHPKKEFFGASPALANVHPVPGHATENCTEQMGVNGHWHERLPHFRMEFTPSSGKELQSEYIIPRSHAYEALCSLAQLKEIMAPLLYICEVRSIAEDQLWMSPCYNQESIAIHFTWKDDWKSVQKLLPTIEQQLQPYQARPHWGKLFTMTPQYVQSAYPRLPQFQQLLHQYDPTGKFRNAFLNTYLFS
ncbi:FAD-binding protein [Bacillus alkalicellulosilyticus]|uniref:FAD-binding protein n=1 Tax=Alkalihalobacterium alkalicellulosilyticum TaxID=1912214 RepID=UPI00099627D1|nr:D-arabinono-1,4-lactone oxidase [Bacillus alkalicellulosilyticus]